VANEWPTRVNPLLDLASLFTVLAQAQEYNPITIGAFHIDIHPEIHLHTHDQASAEAHRLSTPCYSNAPAAPLLWFPSPPHPIDHGTAQAPTPVAPPPITDLFGEDIQYPLGYSPRRSYPQLLEATISQCQLPCICCLRVKHINTHSLPALWCHTYP
jgi:hypothetical protein